MFTTKQKLLVKLTASPAGVLVFSASADDGLTHLSGEWDPEFVASVLRLLGYTCTPPPKKGTAEET